MSSHIKTINWMNPAKIEKQSILNDLIFYREHAKGKLLDVGCGQKPYEKIFNPLIKEYVGLDLNNPKADFNASGLNMPFKKNSFETILSTQVIEHVENPKKW